MSDRPIWICTADGFAVSQTHNKRRKPAAAGEGDARRQTVMLGAAQSREIARLHARLEGTQAGAARGGR